MRILITLFLLLVSTSAHAELWVCFDETTKEILKRDIGDGFKLGYSGLNNKSIVDDCILATKEEFVNAGISDKKVNTSLLRGNRVIDMSSQDIAERNQKIQSALNKKTSDRNKVLDNSISGVRVSDATLTKVDAQIDAITNLNEAKTFLKKLTRYIITIR